MKLHDLRPAPGSHHKKRRVGRGIAAGQGKTAGRGTKGQKARAGGTVPAWFEGGQTPLHQRIPKLRGFKNPFKIHYEVVNVGAIAGLAELGVLESGEMPGAKKPRGAAAAPITVNQEILRAAGLVRTLDRPLKILGNGELATPLFVVADAVSASARAKIEAAGGTISLLEVPTTRVAALGTEDDGSPAATLPAADAAIATDPAAEPPAAAPATADASTDGAEPEAPAKPRTRRTRVARASTAEAEPGPDADAEASEAVTEASEAKIEAETEPEAQTEPEADTDTAPGA